MISGTKHSKILYWSNHFCCLLFMNSGFRERPYWRDLDCSGVIKYLNISWPPLVKPQGKKDLGIIFVYWKNIEVFLFVYLRLNSLPPCSACHHISKSSSTRGNVKSVFCLVSERHSLIPDYLLLQCFLLTVHSPIPKLLRG